MGMGYAPTWLRQVSPLLHKTTLTTGPDAYFHSPVEFRTRTESESVIGRALSNVGQ